MDINQDMEYEKNPFEMEFFIGKKSRYIPVDGLVGVADGGEMVRDKVYIKREQIYDKKKFIKFYLHSRDILLKLNASGCVALFILLGEISMGKDYVWMVWCSDYEVGRSAFSKGVANLINAGMLAKSNQRGKYWINLNVLNRG